MQLLKNKTNSLMGNCVNVLQVFGCVFYLSEELNPVIHCNNWDCILHCCGQKWPMQEWWYLRTITLHRCISNLFGLLPPFQLKEFSAPLPPKIYLYLHQSHIVVMRLLNWKFSNYLLKSTVDKKKYNNV